MRGLVWACALPSFRCAMRKIVIDNGDVLFSLSYNFSLDEWEKSLTTELRRKFLSRARTYIEEKIDKRFKDERGPQGFFWVKHSKITTRYRFGGSTKKLQFTGKLRKSIKVSVYGEEVIASTHLPYARTQQEGASFLTTKRQTIWMWYHLFDGTGHKFTRKRITIPARPFFGFGKVMINGLRTIMIETVKESERLGK